MLPSPLQNFEFALPLCLWGLVLIPFVWAFYGLFYRQGFGSRTKLEAFADPHLLPHLLAEDEHGPRKSQTIWKSLLIWSGLWMLGILAMAGPRWDYTEVEAFTPARDLVVILDMSRSMDAQDVKPSRMARARQEIEDINLNAKGMNIALIAFDSAVHVITPLTDDRSTLEGLLPSLNTGLVYTHGANLVPALKRAGEMLAAQPGGEKHILVLSDGGFEDGAVAILKAERMLLQQGVKIHTMGLGTTQGAPIPDGKGGFVKEKGNVVLSHLDDKALRRIAQDGDGVYLEASYLDRDTKAILSQAERPATGGVSQKTTRFWEERFYVFLAPLAVFLLPWFRRGTVFPLLLLVLLFPAPAQAFDWRDLFLNREQQGRQAVEQKQYDEALEKFDDPYRRGVAQYKAGDFEAAEKSFAEAKRPEVEASARYNLGNSQLMSGKVEDAIKSYEDVLKSRPDDPDAVHNLEIAKKMLEEQKTQQQQNKDQNNQQQDKNNQQQQDQNGQGQDNKDQDQKEDQQNGQQNARDQPVQDQSKDQSHEDAQSQNGDDQKQESSEDQAGNQSDQEQQDSQAQNNPKDGEKSSEEQSAENQEKNTLEQKNEAQGQDEKQQQAQSSDQKQDEQKQDQHEQAQQKSEQQEVQDQASRDEDAQERADRQSQDSQPGDHDKEESGMPRQAKRTQQDIDADQWLDRIKDDPQAFLKNKFYIESKRQNAREGDQPW
ncbi:MAG: VWA domain-containing protein [Alphaproteobacteria bacterium]|nr:VWA domain-containing protein [Alphaproteobacteria bacterium]